MQAMSEMHDKLTWTSLLAHWTAFAQSSLALPKGAEGDRWRDSVPAIIGLQAIAQALAELDRLGPQEDRAVAQDRAAVGIQTHARTLHALWKGESLHPELAALIDDARRALAATREGGVEWVVTAERLVVDHPADLVAALLAAGFDGDLYLPVPGTVLFRHSPAAFARTPTGQAPDAGVTGAVRAFLNEGGDEHGGVAKHTSVPVMRQVYRQFDFGLTGAGAKKGGGAVRDLVQPMNAELAAGQAQLVPAILAGQPVPVTLPIPGMAGIGPLPVVFGPTEHERA